MARILLGISILLTLLTGVLGFLTKGKVAELRDNEKSARQSAAAAGQKATKAESDLRKANDELTAATATIAEREKEIARQKSEVDELSKKITAANAAVEAKTKELAEVSAKLSQIPGDTVDPTKLAEKLTQLTTELNRAQTELAEANQVRITLEEQKRVAEDKMTVAEHKVREYQGPIVRAGLTGRVLAYNPGWNFVVLNIGDRAGVKANTNMLVVRGGQAIAKVRVTSVEPSTAIADVVAGTIARGTTVQPGDSVVYEGRR